MSTAENKELIRNAFEVWATGEGDFFRLLADDAVWTITGSSPVAGTYASRRAFVDGALRPISARLSQPIRPTVRTIIAEGDWVVVLWDGHAVATDGRPYDNTYCWLMRLEDGQI